MKSKFVLWLALLICSANFINVSFAQPNLPPPPPPVENREGIPHPHAGEEGPGLGPKIPGLTKDQEEAFKKLHVNLEKEILPIENQIGEKEAKLRTLTTVENPDLSEINSVIDDISVLKAKIEKLHMALRMNIRRQLNDDQRAMFDRAPKPMKPFPPPPQNQ